MYNLKDMQLKFNSLVVFTNLIYGLLLGVNLTSYAESAYIMYIIMDKCIIIVYKYKCIRPVF